MTEESSSVPVSTPEARPALDAEESTSKNSVESPIQGPEVVAAAPNNKGMSDG